MSGLSLSFLCNLRASIYKVYESSIRSIIACSNVQDLSLLHYILSKTVVSDNVFQWIVQSTKSNSQIISCLIKNKLSFAQKLEQIMKVLDDSRLEQINCVELEKLLIKAHISLKSQEKHYLFTLLTNHDSNDYCKRFPVENIYNNHEPVDCLIDEAIHNAAYFADHVLLKHIIEAASQNGIKCEFDPEDPSHNKLLPWLKENIIKGCGGKNDLGWRDGPDSGKWPSTELKDYLKTLLLLYEIMC